MLDSSDSPAFIGVEGTKKDFTLVGKETQAVSLVNPTILSSYQGADEYCVSG